MSFFLFLLGGVARAQETPRIENITAGLPRTATERGDEAPSAAPSLSQNVFKIAVWAPLWFDVVGEPGMRIRPQLRTADPDGRAVLSWLPEITIPAGGRERVRGGFRSGRITAPLQIRLLNAEDQALNSVTLQVNADGPLRGLPQSTQLWLAVGRHRLLAPAARLWNGSSADAVVLSEIAEDQPVELTDDLLAGVDAVFLSRFTGITPESSAALRDWVGRGGRLVVSIGKQTETLRRSPLADWLPAIPSVQIDVANLQSLNELVNSQNKLRLTSSNRLPAGRLDASRGRALASSLTEILILRSSFGAGMVTMSAISLDEDVLTDWDPLSQADLSALLTDRETPWKPRNVTGGTRTDGNWNATGVTDIQTQLLMSVDNYPEVPQYSHWHIMGWVALFAVIIGPVDYLLVRYLLKRPEWTWGTLTLWAALASLLALSEGSRLGKSPALAKQVDLVDLDCARGVARAYSWRSDYSPEQRRADWTITPSEKFPGAAGPPRLIELGWPTRPEAGFRGIYLSGGVDESRPAYMLSSERNSLRNFPQGTRSSSAFQGFWESPEHSAEFATAQLRRQGDSRITGTLKHNLPGVLTDWLLAYADFAYEGRLGEMLAQELPSGVEFRLEDAKSTLLSSRLRGLRQFSDKSGDKQRVGFSRDEYDPQGDDPLEIARALTFYTVAGGKGYTHLDNQSLGRLDLSPILNLNHAVLFGRLKISPSEISSSPASAEPSREVFVRLLLPVERGS